MPTPFALCRALEIPVATFFATLAKQHPDVWLRKCHHAAPGDRSDALRAMKILVSLVRFRSEPPSLSRRRNSVAAAFSFQVYGTK